MKATLAPQSNLTLHISVALSCLFYTACSTSVSRAAIKLNGKIKTKISLSLKMQHRGDVRFGVISLKVLFLIPNIQNLGSSQGQMCSYTGGSAARWNHPRITDRKFLLPGHLQAEVQVFQHFCWDAVTEKQSGSPPILLDLLTRVVKTRLSWIE